MRIEANYILSAIADMVLLTDETLVGRIKELAPEGVNHIVEAAFAANIKTDVEVLAQGGSISSAPRHGAMQFDVVTGIFMTGVSHWCDPLGFGAIGDSALAETDERVLKIFIRLFFVILKVKGYSNEVIADILSVAMLKEAQDRIEKSTGIKRSISQIRAFLQRIKIKRRKVGQIPSKANLKAQKRFKEEKTVQCSRCP